MDDRRLTLIIVPHGDLETRTFEVSYRRLRFLGWVAFLGLTSVILAVGFWFFLLIRTSRVERLEVEVARLNRERAKVDTLADLLAHFENQYERVRQALGADGPAARQRPVLSEIPQRSAVREAEPEEPEGPSVDAWPLGNVRGFITRGRTGDNHPGVDIAVPISTYVRAAGPGRVTEASQHQIYGNYLKIDHGNGLETIYGHASRLLVTKNDTIRRLQIIALSGNTGRSTAPHLHFEVRKDGKAVDPLRYVKQP